MVAEVAVAVAAAQASQSSHWAIQDASDHAAVTFASCKFNNNKKQQELTL